MAHDGEGESDAKASANAYVIGLVPLAGAWVNELKQLYT